jgi:hypothetical protein
VLVATALSRRVKTPRQSGAITDQLALLGSASCFGAAVAARELFNTSSRVDKFLFAREKRMASSADADFNVLTGRTRVIDNSARTDHIGLVILRMNTAFHDRKRARNLA